MGTLGTAHGEAGSLVVVEALAWIRNRVSTLPGDPWANAQTVLIAALSRNLAAALLELPPEAAEVATKRAADMIHRQVTHGADLYRSELTPRPPPK